MAHPNSCTLLYVSHCIAKGLCKEPAKYQLLSQQAGHPTAAPQPPAAALQDESACIGCKQCVWCASGVFRMEPEYGRSRAFAQWCDTEDHIQVGLTSSVINSYWHTSRQSRPLS